MASDFDKQMEKVCTADGFLAALDQSGGSTPKALKLYGIPDDSYVKGEQSMFDAVHAMRTRIMTSPAFHGDRILGSILFEDTMDRTINDKPTVKFLWEGKNVVPFLKVDKGLEAEWNGVQLMKPMPGLDDLLKRAKENGVFGTKMRSVINLANAEGINANVAQQFEIGKRICAAGLIPILEPEVNIRSIQKEEIEDVLLLNLLENLDKLEPNEKVMLKLTLPTKDDLYGRCIEHPNVLRVAALSGGYTRAEANEKLAMQKGMIASFSRALTEGLKQQMTNEEFNKALDDSIGRIFEASIAPTVSTFDKQMEKVCTEDGFLAALDQSGGSTPKALKLYGIPDDSYVKGEQSMFDAVHAMRTRIMTSPAFQGDRILGAILFEDTMDRKINDKPTVKFLWEGKNVVPFLKVDKGLEAEWNGVQLMKPMPALDHLLKRAKDNGVFGTKMRSVINLANAEGIKANVAQQFEIGKRICAAGLIPILEPEVNIRSIQKEEIEDVLLLNLLENLDKLEPNEKVMLKLTLPTKDNLYSRCIEHPNVLRVAALSGGYTRAEANEKLAMQKGMIASFSRALTEGLMQQMTDEEFNEALNDSIGSIFEASKAPSLKRLSPQEETGAKRRKGFPLSYDEVEWDKGAFG